MLRSFCFGAAMTVCGALGAQAEPILGEWRSEPDRKGQTGIIEIVPCGGAFCGTIVRAYDEGGQRVVTENVGRQIVSDMRPDGAGSYAGRVYVPLMKGEFPATVRVGGGRLVVRGCNKLGMCMDQTLERIN